MRLDMRGTARLSRNLLLALCDGSGGCGGGNGFFPF